MDLKLDRANPSVPYDISFTDGKLDVVDGIDEIKTRYLFNLSVYLGENYKEADFGVDYFNNVLGRSTDDTVAIDELKAAIIGTRGNDRLEEFSLTQVPNTRNAELEAQAFTTEGEVDLTTTITI